MHSGRLEKRKKCSRRLARQKPKSRFRAAARNIRNLATKKHKKLKSSRIYFELFVLFCGPTNRGNHAAQGGHRDRPSRRRLSRLSCPLWNDRRRGPTETQPWGDDR